MIGTESSRSMLVDVVTVAGKRWDNGYHNFQQGAFLKAWARKFDLVPLGKLITQDSYGILTPGDVYSAEHPITYVRVTDMRPNMGIDFEDVLKVPEEYYRHERARIRKHDVLLAVKGASIASNKSVAFVEDVDTKAIVNGTIFRFQVKPEHNPFYVAAMLDSRILKDQIRSIQISNNAVSYIDKPSIYALQIPLPPRKIQDYIARLLNNAYEEKRRKLDSVKEYLRTLDEYVFKILNIFPQNVQEETRFLVGVDLIAKKRFDVDYNMGFKKFEPFIESVSPIGAAVTFPNRLINPAANPETIFKYIDIASIDVHLGEISQAKDVTGAEAPSRARQLVRAGDIIISTVRPTRGATALVPTEMNGFVCSTGFAVVHPAQDVIPEYLHIALRLGTTLEQFGRYSSGSSYPAILERDIKQTIIPLPPKDVQQKVVKEIGKRRAKAKQLMAEADGLILQSKLRIERIILGEEKVA
ncbi:MAG: type restriction enzyme subunit [Acidobacteriota bacterium]|jgi:type I restriction enzyme S subunit|nr:type restriction enzyme subunit [Acidobacteriota bacterium]